MGKNSDFRIIVITQENEMEVASAILLISYYLKIRLGIDPDVTLLDNNSSDRTVSIATRIIPDIFRYRIRKRKVNIVKTALRIGRESKCNTLILLDLTGGNIADDAISLISRSIEEGERFASAYIHPVEEGGSIGCWAIDKGLLSKVGKGPEMDIEQRLQSLASMDNLELLAIDEKVSLQPKKKRYNIFKVIWRSPLVSIPRIIKYHPLLFYGSIGMIILFLAMVSGVYTVDYFYREGELNYFPAFTTMALIMIGGFFMVAGIMLNALLVLVEKLEALKKWMD